VECSQIFISGHHLADFDHRLPLGNVKFLDVDGTLTLKQVGVSHKALVGAASYILNAEQSMPFEQELRGGAGVLITGKTDQDSFAINLRDSQGGILLHVNPRFNEKVWPECICTLTIE